MGDENKQYACCFFGHRRIIETPELKERLIQAIEALITEKDVTDFYFGSKSDFDTLCLKTVTHLKEKYPYIKRIYVRSAFPEISDSYKNYLLESYEETYFPKKIRNAGKAAYVERNQEMIKKSKFCIVYYDEEYAPPRRKNSKRELTDYQPKSGTKIAYNYAVNNDCDIINIFRRCDIDV